MIDSTPIAALDSSLMDTPDTQATTVDQIPVGSSCALTETDSKGGVFSADLAGPIMVERTSPAVVAVTATNTFETAPTPTPTPVVDPVTPTPSPTETRPAATARPTRTAAPSATRTPKATESPGLEALTSTPTAAQFQLGRSLGRQELVIVMVVLALVLLVAVIVSGIAAGRDKNAER